jgi:hypothetical protein
VLLDGGKIFVGVSRYGDNMYVSSDGGKSFGAMKGGPQNLMPAAPWSPTASWW